jgi:hypothetical protein
LTALFAKRREAAGDDDSEAEADDEDNASVPEQQEQSEGKGAQGEEEASDSDIFDINWEAGEEEGEDDPSDFRTKETQDDRGSESEESVAPRKKRTKKASPTWASPRKKRGVDKSDMFKRKQVAVWLSSIKQLTSQVSALSKHVEKQGAVLKESASAAERMESSLEKVQKASDDALAQAKLAPERAASILAGKLAAAQAASKAIAKASLVAKTTNTASPNAPASNKPKPAGESGAREAQKTTPNATGTTTTTKDKPTSKEPDEDVAASKAGADDGTTPERAIPIPTVEEETQVRLNPSVYLLTYRRRGDGMGRAITSHDRNLWRHSEPQCASLVAIAFCP